MTEISNIEDAQVFTDISDQWLCWNVAYNVIQGDNFFDTHATEFIAKILQTIGDNAPDPGRVSIEAIRNYLRSFESATGDPIEQRIADNLRKLMVALNVLKKSSRARAKTANELPRIQRRGWRFPIDRGAYAAARYLH